MIRDIIRLQEQIKERKPLIHCITNPISIHDCANMVLAVGGIPIMAEHPKEAAQITASADALLLNLGNITDVRMESMEISLRTAKAQGIPVLLDLVGTACSKLRFEYANHLLSIGGITVLKGNMSEMLAMVNLPSHSVGIDAGKEDALNDENCGRITAAFQDFSHRTGTVILVSGKTDLVVSPEHVYYLSNGNPMMSAITGTGCMLGAVCTTCLPGADPIHSVILGTAIMGIAGEQAAVLSKGPGTFQTEFLDQVYLINPQILTERIRIEEA